MIIAFRSPVPLPAGNPPPARLCVLPWGRNEGVQASPICNETTAALLPQNQRIANFDTAILDFNHNTLPGTEAYKSDKEPRKIAAKGKVELIPGEGLYFSALDWTPEGKDAWTGGHFPDLSPAVKMNDAGEVIFIHSAGLCQQGSITGLHAFSVGGLPAMKASTATPPTTPPMDYKKLLCITYGLDPEKATDAEIEAAAAAFAKKNAETPAKPETPSADPAATAAITALTASVKAINDRMETQDRQIIINQALAQGKVIPNGVEKLPLEQFKTVVDALPADQVPMDKRTPEGVKAFTSPGLGNDAEQAAINRQLGLSPETFAKHNK